MTVAANPVRYRQPVVNRLGFEDGWWFFHPHFLNLGLPLLLVDACFLPDAAQLGLEVFGLRRPDVPLPVVPLRVEVLGDGVRVHTVDRSPRLIAQHWFRSVSLPRLLCSSTSVGVILGDSYALQLSWSALWTCHVGTVCQDPLTRT